LLELLYSQILDLVPMTLSYQSLFGWTNHLDSAIDDGEEITFSLFYDPTPYDGTSPAVNVGWQEDIVYPYSHSEEQAIFVRSVFSRLDPLIDLDFSEVEYNSSADISVFRAWGNSYWTELGWDESGLGGGTCHYLYDGADVVWRDIYENDEFNVYEQSTIVHEIGHALGLDHPDGVGANPDWDEWDSIMSYNDRPGWDEATWFSELDILALQALWGVEDDELIDIDDYGSSLSDHGFLGVEASVNGELEKNGDLDWFAVDLVDGFKYEFTLIGDSLIDPTLTFFDDAGNSIEYNDDADGFGSDSQIIYQASSSGTYFLQAAGYNYDSKGTYSLSAVLLEDGNSGNPLDVDNDGFVDDVTNYQMYSGSTIVDLTHRGRTFSDQSSRQWDATKAVVVADGFDVLLEGAGRRDDRYRVVAANSSGAVTGASRWYTGTQMNGQGYEDIFAIDFNSNGSIGM
jgi:hypothetical protein